MSDQDFVKELFLAYAKQGHKPHRCRELVQSALSNYSKVEIPKGVYLPHRVNIHRGGTGLPDGFIRFNGPIITPQAAEEFRKEYKKFYAGVDPAPEDSKGGRGIHVVYVSSKDYDGPMEDLLAKIAKKEAVRQSMEEQVDDLSKDLLMTPSDSLIAEAYEMQMDIHRSWLKIRASISKLEQSRLVPYSKQVESLGKEGMYGPGELEKYKEGVKPWSELAGKVPDNSLDASEKEALEKLAGKQEDSSACDDVDAPVPVRFIKYTNNFGILKETGHYEANGIKPSVSIGDLLSELNKAGALHCLSDGVVNVVVLKGGGGTEVVPLTLEVATSGKVLWPELRTAGITTQEQLDLFLEDYGRSLEAQKAIRDCVGKPENFHTGGADNFAPVDPEVEDGSYNPYCEIRFKGKSKFNGDEWAGYYVYSPTTGKHYIVQDVLESIDGVSTCLSGFDEIDPSTLGYSFVTGTAVEPEAKLVPPLDSDDTVPRRGVSVTMSSAHMRPLHGMGEWTPVVINGYVILAYMNGEGKWQFGFEKYAKLSEIMQTRHPVRSVGGYTHCMALNA